MLCSGSHTTPLCLTVARPPRGLALLAGVHSQDFAADSLLRYCEVDSERCKPCDKAKQHEARSTRAEEAKKTDIVARERVPAFRTANQRRLI